MSDGNTWKRRTQPPFVNVLFQVLDRPVMLDFKGDGFSDGEQAMYDIRVMWDDWEHVGEILLAHTETNSQIVRQLKPYVSDFLDRHAINPEQIEVSIGNMKAKVFWSDTGERNLYTISIYDENDDEVESAYHDFLNTMPYSETVEYVRDVLTEYLSMHKSFNDMVKSIRSIVK